MEYNEVTVEHSTSPVVNQHYQTHFQQHYSATGTPIGTPLLAPRFPHVTPIVHQTMVTPMLTGGGGETRRQEFSSRHQGPMSSYESHAEIVHSNGIDQNGNLSQVQEKHEKQSSKKTVQTTTTTTTSQPALIVSGAEHHALLAPAHTTIETITQHGGEPSNEASSYTIQVEHRKPGFDWSNADTYLHIFLTFFFGYLAAILFFDGIIRSIVNLYILDHTAMSPLIYILYIIFSICMLAFIIWFLTICWRWWRNKSLLPTKNYDQYSRQVGPRERQYSPHNYVFLAGCIMVAGFLIYLSVGIVDICFKREQEFYNKQFRRYSKALFMADLLVFAFNLIFWLVGIIAIFLLSRDVLAKYCCPARQIRINKEQPTTIYQVRD